MNAQTEQPNPQGVSDPLGVNAADVEDRNSNETSTSEENSGAKIYSGCALQVEESTLKELPSFVENIFVSFDKRDSAQIELLLALIYCIGMESGFYNKSQLPDILAFQSSYSYHFENMMLVSKLGFPKLFKQEDIYKMELQLFCQLAQEDLKGKNDCCLTAIKSGDHLIVTLIIKNLPGRSVCLPISRYVLSLKNKEFSFRFRNLKELSMILKEEMFLPSRNIFLDTISNCTFIFPGLQGLTFDALAEIMKRIKSIKDLENLSKTCKLMNSLCYREYIGRKNKNI